MLCVQRAEDFVKVFEGGKKSILCQLNEERRQKIENNRHVIIQIRNFCIVLGGKTLPYVAKLILGAISMFFFKTKRSMI